MTERRVRCQRTYPVPPDRVFRAWTEPTLITRWWSPDETIAVEVLAWDLVPGGAWRFGYRFPDGRLVHVRGRFLDITPPSRLAFTWTWEAPDVHAGIETHVTVALRPDGDGTTVELLHEQFPDDESRDRHDAGWVATLDRLTEVL